jgi:hypothetical protein
MSIRKNLLLILLNVLFVSSVHGQSYNWAKAFGDVYTTARSQTMIGNEHTKYLCTDINKNLYAAIFTSDSTLKADTFYQAGGQNQSIASGGVLLVASYTCGGSMRWARLLENRGDVICYGMEYHAGSIYIVGRFGDSTSPNRYVAGARLTGHDSQHYFLARYDTLGSLRWMRFVGANDQSSAVSWLPANKTPGTDDHSMGVDGYGNIHHFVYLNSGVKVTPTLTAQKGTYDLKYDTSGNLLGAVRLSVDSVYYLVGRTIYSNVGPGSKNAVCISKKSGKIFAAMSKMVGTTAQFRLCAFSSGGALLWEDTLSGTNLNGTTGGGGIRDVIYDGNTGIYLSGDGVFGQFRLNGYSPTYIPALPNRSLSAIIKVDTNGTVQWIYANEHSSNVGMLANTTLLPSGNILAAGCSSGVARHGKDSVALPVGGSGPFYSIVSPSGILVKMDVVQRKSSNFNSFTAAAVDKVGGIYLGGMQQSDTLRFIGGPISVKAPNPLNVADAFIARMGLDCRCTGVAKAAFKDSMVNEKTVYFTYTGTTEAIDSIVWYFGGGQKKKVTSGYTTPFIRSYASGAAYSRDSVLVVVYSGCGVDSSYRYPPPLLGVAGLSALSELQVYPNPTHTGSLKVILESTAMIREATLVLTDITGRRVYEQTLQPNSSVLHEEIAVPHAVPGVYILEVRAGNERMVRRVVVE